MRDTNKFFKRIEYRRDEENKPLENILSQLENIAEGWEVTFDELDGKYIIKKCDNFNLAFEEFGWIYSMGFHIFNIRRYDEVVEITLFHHKGSESFNEIKETYN